MQETLESRDSIFANSKIIVEIMLYISILCRVFGNEFGVLAYPGLSGAIIVMSGITCFIIMSYNKVKMPVSIIFVFIIVLIATITDFYIYKLISVDMIIWMCTLLMACYVAKNTQSTLRFVYFLSFIVILSVFLGGSYIGQNQGYERLTLKGSGIGSMFSNSNALAQVAVMTATCLFFSSFALRSFYKALCLCFALCLSIVVLMTLSRQGLVFLVVSILFFIFASIHKKISKSGVLILLTITLFVVMFFNVEFNRLVESYQYRLSLNSDRVAYWSTAYSDMTATLFSGNGGLKAYSSVGIVPHNTFLWIHLAYGGPCAYVYLFWLLYIMIKSTQVILSYDEDIVCKYMTLAILVLFLLGQSVNVFAPGNYGYILGIAVLESNFILSDEIHALRNKMSLDRIC